MLRNNSKQRTEWFDADAAAVVGAEIAKTLTDQERRAVNFVAEYGKANTTEVVRLLGIDWQTANKLLQRLASKKILKHIHRTDIARDPRAHFILASKNNSTDEG